MKAFILYKLIETPVIDDNVLSKLRVVEPSPEQWHTMGFVPHPTLYADQVEEGMMASEKRTNEQSVIVSIIERILPRATIKRHLLKLIKDFESEHGQKVTNKQIAECKEQFVKEMLPNCPLKETRVEVSFDFETMTMLVGTSSQKIADAIVSFLSHKLNPNPENETDVFHLKVELWRPKKISAWLNDAIEDDEIAYASCKLKNLESEQKVSFSNDLGCVDAIRLITEKGRSVVINGNEEKGVNMMQVIELGCRINEHCVFSINEKAVVKSIKYLISEEKQSDLNDIPAEEVTAYEQATHLLKVDAKRKIIKLFSQMEEYDENDL